VHCGRGGGGHLNRQKREPPASRRGERIARLGKTQKNDGAKNGHLHVEIHSKRNDPGYQTRGGRQAPHDADPEGGQHLFGLRRPPMKRKGSKDALHESGRSGLSGGQASLKHLFKKKKNKWNRNREKRVQGKTKHPDRGLLQNRADQSRGSEQGPFTNESWKRGDTRQGGG